MFSRYLIRLEPYQRKEARNETKVIGSGREISNAGQALPQRTLPAPNRGMPEDALGRGHLVEATLDVKQCGQPGASSLRKRPAVDHLRSRRRARPPQAR